MEFGAFMEFHRRADSGDAEAFDESFELVRMAEDLGLDAVWLAESHFNPDRSVLASPLVIASAIAAGTERIKVGTAVQVLPLNNPLRTAEEAATVDQLSQGRFEFGVGRSGLPGAYEGYNIPYGESQGRFVEYLEIILQAWTNERFSYQGNYFSVDDVCVVPKPFQQPHPPIRVAANTPETFPWVGDMGFPIFIGLRLRGIPEVAEYVGAYQQAWTEAGHEENSDVSLRVPVYVADTDAEAFEQSEESFMRQFRKLSGQITQSAVFVGADNVEDRLKRGEQLATISWQQALREKVAVGSPERVIDRLHEIKEALHLSGIAAEFNAGERIPKDNIVRSLRLFCEKVVPAFK